MNDIYTFSKAFERNAVEMRAIPVQLHPTVSFSQIGMQENDAETT